MNPYEVLGISPGATQEQIKSAYKNLVKQYHPDKYVNNPLQDLAKQKMADINEAYAMLTKGGVNSGSGNYSDSASMLRQVRNYIQSGNLSAAEGLLNSISDRNAEWYFLTGIVYYNKGWYDQAMQNMQTACNMDPNNAEYNQTMYQMRNRTNGYSNNYYRTSGRNNECSDCCGCCADIWCLDTLCECFGGDLCSCM